MNNTKTCRKCNEEKSRDCFDTKLDAADRLHPYCKDCRRSIAGAKKRQPPKLAVVDRSLVETLESRCQDKEYAEIVAEALTYAEHPAMKKKRVVRNNAERLSEQPVLNFEKDRWSEQDEAIADMIYEAWEKRQKQDQEKFRKVNKKYPIFTKQSTKDYSMREGLSYDLLLEMNIDENE